MIIRILGEGQFVADATDLAELNVLDAEVEAAALAGDQTRLSGALTALLNRVRAIAQVVADDVLADSDLILPDESATVDEIRQLLDETAEYPGLIPES